MSTIKIRYVRLRVQGDDSVRPRSAHGPRERVLGFKDGDLKHDDGRWFTRDEARAWSLAHIEEIAAARGNPVRKRAPVIAKGRSVADLWEAYSRSDKFLGNPEFEIKGLSSASQKTYKAFVKPLTSELLWRAPVAALDPEIIKAVHGRVVKLNGLATANGAIAVLSAMLAWGRLFGWLPKVNGQVVNNPATRLDLPSPPERVRVASDAELAALLAAADKLGKPAVGDAILAGFYTGQRLSDVLAFVETEAAPGRMALKQFKTGRLVSIPFAPSLAERFRKARARNHNSRALTLIVYEGRPYNISTFSEHYRAVRAAAAKACPSLADFQFRDLRDTAVTWYARAECNPLEIASITGHSPASVLSILKHYLALDGHLADNAVRKLMSYMDRLGVAV